MKRATTLFLLATAAFVLVHTLVSAQAPPAGAPPAQGAPARAGGPAAGPGGAAGGRGGRGGVPGATTEQLQAIAEMNVALNALNAAVTTARNDLATATFADVKNTAAITAAVDKLKAAELALATKRAEEFAKIQAGPNKLNAEQVTALIAAGGNIQAGGGRGGGGGAAPGGGRGAAPGAPGAPAPGRGN